MNNTIFKWFWNKNSVCVQSFPVCGLNYNVKFQQMLMELKKNSKHNNNLIYLIVTPLKSGASLSAKLDSMHTT